MQCLTRDQVRRVDQLAIEKYGIPGIVLMENAGRGVVDVMCQVGIQGLVLIACGRGNNAGDGFVMARHLDLRGFQAVLFCFGDPAQLAGDAAANYRIARAAGLTIHVVERADGDFETAIQGADWVVDALLGTGAMGAPRSPMDEAIRTMNKCNGHRLAVDVPSGLDCDTGVAANPTFAADHTCTFVAAKPGLMLPSAKSLIGQLHVLDIGAPRRLIEEVAAETES